MSTLFQALMAEKHDNDVSVHVKTMSKEDLPKEGFLIKIDYSGINYND
ncbi:oxidoreductase, partial [Bacillus vallismortis]|nr:oxidoreductase [Bacillus vallismortis]